MPGTAKQVRMSSRGSEGIDPGLSNCGRTQSRFHGKVKVTSYHSKW